MGEIKKGVIYKVTSPNGKIYIGQTINLKNRLKKYKYDFSGQKKLWNNCQKHNWNPNDSVEVIEECLIDNLNEREIYWIGIYDSYKIGLNCDLGGGGRTGYVCSDETKEKLRKINLGKKLSEETKQKIRETHSKIPKDFYKNRESRKGCKLTDEHIKKIKDSKKRNPFIMSDEQRKKVSDANMGNKKRLGKTHSDESKNKISESKKGVPNYSKDVKIICIDTGVIYNSQREAADKLNLKVGSILRVCNKGRKTYKGLVFIYYDEYINKDK